MFAEWHHQGTTQFVSQVRVFDRPVVPKRASVNELAKIIVRAASACCSSDDDGDYVCGLGDWWP